MDSPSKSQKTFSNNLDKIVQEIVGVAGELHTGEVQPTVARWS
jgi:hypothetical protein